MPRKPSRPKKNESFNITVTLPGDLAVELDRCAKDCKSTRSDVVRLAIGGYLDAYVNGKLELSIGKE